MVIFKCHDCKFTEEFMNWLYNKYHTNNFHNQNLTINILPYNKWIYHNIINQFIIGDNIGLVCRATIGIRFPARNNIKKAGIKDNEYFIFICVYNEPNNPGRNYSNSFLDNIVNSDCLKESIDTYLKESNNIYCEFMLSLAYNPLISDIIVKKHYQVLNEKAKHIQRFYREKLYSPTHPFAIKKCDDIFENYNKDN